MFPSLTKDNIPNVLLRYPVLFCQVLACSTRGVCRPNLHHVLRRQFCLAVSFSARQQSQGASVQGVGPLRYIFEVVKSRIGLYTVNVVYGQTTWSWAKKCNAYKSVNISGRSALFGRERDCGVFGTGLYLRFYQSITKGVRRSSHAHNAAKIRHGVKAFIADNGLPDFTRKFFGGKFLNRHGVNLQAKVALWLEPFGCFNARAARLV